MYNDWYANYIEGKKMKNHKEATMETTNILVRFKGEAGCFANPATSPQCYSYCVPTYSAIKGMLDSIYWKPEFEYNINSITILNPFKYGKTRMCRETPDQASPGLLTITPIIDLDYVVDASIKLVKPESENRNNTTKHYNILQRRILKGASYSVPHFGQSNFLVDSVELCNKTELPKSYYEFEDAIPLGTMFHSFQYGKEKNEGYYPIEKVLVMPNVIMEKGIIDFRKQIIVDVENPVQIKTVVPSESFHSSLISFFDNELASGIGSKVPEMGFQFRKYHVIIDIDKNGNIINTTEIKEQCHLPMNPARSSNILPTCLYDNASYFISDKKKGYAKLVSFREYHNKYFSELKSPAIQAFLKLLNRENGYIESKMPQKSISTPTNIVVFRMDGNFIHNDEEALNVWRKEFKEWSGYEENTEQAISLISGEKIHPIRLQLPIHKCKMFSANKGISEHYKRNGLDNQCPCSWEENYKYAEALTYLYNSTKHCIIMPDRQTHIVFWTDKDNAEVTDFISMLNDDDEANRQNMTKNIKKIAQGILANRDASNADYKVNILMLTFLDGQNKQNKITVRQYLRKSFKEVFTNLLRYTELFEEFSNIYDYKHSIPTIRNLVKTLYPQGESYQSYLFRIIFGAIINGEIWNREVHELLIKRISNNPKEYLENLKGLLYVISKYKGDTVNNKNIEVVAQIAAIMDKIRDDLRYSEDMTIVKFSTNFKRSVSAMLSKIQFYINGLSKVTNKRIASYYEKMIVNLMEKIDLDTLTTTRLNSDEITKFILSYYKQKTLLVTKKNKNTSEIPETIEDTEDNESEKETLEM